ncbi:MAG: vWA domain-containing protein [Planctomycetota bacterium]|jgi:Ca-activated chloride channel family protein
MAQVELKCTLNKPHLPVLKTQQLVYVYIEAQAAETMANIRNLLNLALVLDKSGSMEGDKIISLRKAAKNVIDLLDEEDYVSITVFSDRVFKIAPSALASDKDDLKAAIDKIRDGGGTAMSGGMREGLEQLEKNVSPDRLNRMLLLTDGQTFGDEKDCKKLGAEMGDKEIVIQALGLGEDWNEDLLDDVAEASGGQADFIETPDEISDFFQEAVQRMQAAVVQNAELIIRLVNGVVPRQVWRVTPIIENLGYKPISERDVQVDLGTIDVDEGVSLLVELLVSPRPEGSFRIAQTEVNYDVPLMNLAGEKVKADVMIDLTADPQLAKEYDAFTMNLVEKVTAFKLQTRALNAAKMGDTEGASRQLRQAATRLLQVGEKKLADAALQEAQNLEEKGEMSSAGSKKLRYATRRLTRKPRAAREESEPSAEPAETETPQE